MQKIGIYPGTFDPVHIGHLAFAQATLKKCNLEQVIFLPEMMPRGKVGVTSIEQRAEQIEIATQQYSKLGVKILASPQFTVAETLPEIESFYPNVKLMLLIGSDVALFLHTWENIHTLVTVCDIAIGMRSTETEKEIITVLKKLSLKLDIDIPFTIIHTDHASAASSVLRE